MESKKETKHTHKKNRYSSTSRYTEVQGLPTCWYVRTIYVPSYVNGLLSGSSQSPGLSLGQPVASLCFQISSFGRMGICFLFLWAQLWRTSRKAKQCWKPDGVVSKEHRSEIEGTLTDQIWGYLFIKNNNYNGLTHYIKNKITHKFMKIKRKREKIVFDAFFFYRFSTFPYFKNFSESQLEEMKMESYWAFCWGNGLTLAKSTCCQTPNSRNGYF